MKFLNMPTVAFFKNTQMVSWCEGYSQDSMIEVYK